MEDEKNEKKTKTADILLWVFLGLLVIGVLLLAAPHAVANTIGIIVLIIAGIEAIPTAYMLCTLPSKKTSN